MWKRDQAQSWIENISCGGKKKWFGEEMWDKRAIYSFSKKVSPKYRFFRIYEICSWAASKPEMKMDRTCQAGCWGGSVPACSAPHPSACLEGTCQIWLSSHSKWSWCGLDLFVCFCWSKGALLFKHGQLDFQQGTSPPALLYQTLCSSVTWHRYYFFLNYYDDLDVLFSLLPHNWAYLWSIS